METIFQDIDWPAFLAAVWTILIVPVAKRACELLKQKKLNEYAVIFYEETVRAVKAVYETSVKEIKGTKDWTPEKQTEVKELAKAAVLDALSVSAYRCLKKANAGFDAWLDSTIETALYDVKHGQK